MCGVYHHIFSANDEREYTIQFRESENNAIIRLHLLQAKLNTSHTLAVQVKQEQNIFEAPKIPSPILASFMFTSTYT